MKRLIEFFKKLFGCKQVCPKCKSNPCKCEMEVPAEHKIELPESVTTEPVKLECTSTAAIDAAGLNLEDGGLKVESAPTKKKRIRKNKVTPVVEPESPAEDPETPVVEAPVEVPTEKPAEPKKKRSRKKKTESK